VDWPRLTQSMSSLPSSAKARGPSLITVIRHSSPSSPTCRPPTGPLPAAPRTSPAAVTAAEALFWLNLPAVLAFTLVAPYKLATLQSNQLTLPTMTATWLMPALPALVAANSAAVVARVSLHQAPALIVVGESK
jgi:hypothetical protein